MNENMIKKIVSKFIKKGPETINNDTIIDSSIIQGSILFHRMISRINDIYEIEIDNYGDIKKYKHLLMIVKKKVKDKIENRD